MLTAKTSNWDKKEQPGHLFSVSLRRPVGVCFFDAMSTTIATPTTSDRAAISPAHKWDFTPIFPDWDAWEQGMKALDAKMGEFASLKGTLARGPAAVLRAYQLHDEIGMLQYRVYCYPQLRRDVDMRDQAVAGKFQRVQALFAKFGTATAWFTPELLAVPQAEMEKWIAETPGLGIYRFTIDHWTEMAGGTARLTGLFTPPFSQK